MRRRMALAIDWQAQLYTAVVLGAQLERQSAAQRPATGTTGAAPSGIDLNTVVNGVQTGIQRGSTVGFQGLSRDFQEIRNELRTGLAGVRGEVGELHEQVANAAFGGDTEAPTILRELREKQTQIEDRLGAVEIRVRGMEIQRGARRTVQSSLAQRLLREGIQYDRREMSRLAHEIESGRATENEVVERLRAAAPPPPAPETTAPPVRPAAAPPVAPAPPTRRHLDVIPLPTRPTPAPTAMSRNDIANRLAELLGIPSYGMLNEQLIDTALAAPELEVFVDEKLAEAKTRISGRMATIDATRAADPAWIDRTSRLWLGVPVQEDNELEGFLQLRASEG